MSNTVNDIKSNEVTQFKEREKKVQEMGKLIDRTQLSFETVKKNLPNINVMNTQIITKNVEVKKVGSDLSEKEILAVKKHNIDNFYKQIMNNLVVGAKSLFLVCRDLSDAERMLATEDFEILKKTLPLTDSTICKYLKIGKSTTCRELFKINRLPESWTTMYKISTIENKDDKTQKFIDNIDINTTSNDIDVFLGKVRRVLQSLWNYKDLETPKVFLQIAVENDKEIADIDPNVLKIISHRIQKVVSDVLNDFKTSGYNVSKNERPVKVEVSENKTFLKDVEKKVFKYFKSLKDKKLRKDYRTAYDKVGLEITNPYFSKLGS